MAAISCAVLALAGLAESMGTHRPGWNADAVARYQAR
jgi:hypothetical protein